MFDYNDITQMHIEVTNRCNAACPMCMRFYQNSPLLRPDLELGEISGEQFKNWFSPDFLKQIDLILFCGVHGDPCVAKDILEIVEYIIQSSPKTRIRFNTNGGMRNPEFWTKMGNLLKTWSQHWITFSIDGLEDTNHLYRRNVKWEKLIANVKAFTDTGAVAIWDYLIFRHNEHQVDEAKALAHSLNFSQFRPKKALGVDNGKDLKPMVVLDKQGQLDYLIHAPTKPEDRNLENPTCVAEPEAYPFTLEKYKELKETKQELVWHNSKFSSVYNTHTEQIEQKDKEYTGATIKCKSKVAGGIEIFIDNYGRVMPCCYIGTHMNSLYTDVSTLQLHHEVKKYGLDNFDLNKHSLRDIIEGNHLNNLYVDSWSKESVAKGKLSYCLDTCGKCSGIDKIYTHEKDEKIR